MNLYWPRYWVIKGFYVTMFCMLASCGMSMKPPIYGSPVNIPDVVPVTQSASGFEMLPWRGGVAVLAGMALLVISGGRKGWYPLLIGIGLILLNWIVLTYAHALFLPVVVTTGILTLAIGYKIVASILIDRRKTE